jgi:hypothetical protein
MKFIYAALKVFFQIIFGICLTVFAVVYAKKNEWIIVWDKDYNVILESKGSKFYKNDNEYEYLVGDSISIANKKKQLISHE